ncbi:MAG: DUF4442 domain-containing protein [Cyanobacteria bacterium REEB67]|nr:DUF4442 domain-containing protein [Cyanobacteria bacterium REEB67]
MPESFETKKQRFFFNFFPCYIASGAKVKYIASDYRQVKIELGLNWLTRNYVGTIFGGSMFAATDPMFMIMLIKILGKEYIVWDKAGSIKFLKPGKEKLFATFIVSDEDLADIEEKLATNDKTEKTFRVDLVDSKGVACAAAERLIYIRRKTVKGNDH